MPAVSLIKFVFHRSDEKLSRVHMPELNVITSLPPRFPWITYNFPIVSSITIPIGSVSRYFLLSGDWRLEKVEANFSCLGVFQTNLLPQLIGEPASQTYLYGLLLLPTFLLHCQSYYKTKQNKPIRNHEFYIALGHRKR